MGRTAKAHPKDGVSRLNFPEGFDTVLDTFYLKWEAEDIVSKIRVSLEVNTKYIAVFST